MKYFVYILYSENYDKFYYGQTQNVKERLERHNSGTVKSTKKFIPWRIFALAEFDTRSEAFKAEKKLKNCKSRERVKDFLKKNKFIILEES